MADKDLTVHLKADDNITPVAKKAAAELKKLEKPIEVDADVSKVLGAFDDLTAEAKQTAAAAEQLGRALGPELAAKSDTTAIVQDLKQAGLTIDQITANADQLAAKLKEVSDADVGGKLGASLGTARGQIDTMSDSARGANSALANMIGNTTQDLGAMSGVAGSAGVAIGQLGEYAADAALGGEKLSSSLLSMAKVAGPMAAIGLATAYVAKEMKRAAESKAFNVAQAKAFTASIEDTGGVLKAINDQLEDTGELVFKIAGGFDTMDVGGDIAPLLATLNLSTAEFLALVNKGDAAWSQFIQGLKAAGVAEKDLINLQVAHGRILGDQEKAIAAVALKNELLADGTGDLTAATEDAVVATGDLLGLLGSLGTISDFAAGVRDETAALLEQIGVIKEAMDATREMVDARRAAADSTFAVRDAERDLADQLEATMLAIAEHPGMNRENAAALDDVALAAGKAADAQVQLEKDSMASMGATQSAVDAQRTWNASMLQSARTTSGPMHQAIVNYIAQVNGIPPEKVSEILANPDYATIEAATAAIDQAARDRDVAVTVDAYTDDAETEIQRLIRTRNMTINAQIVARGGAGYAPAGTPSGGPFMAPMVATAATLTAAPMAVAGPVPLAVPPIVVNVPVQPIPSITFNRPIMGNRFDIDRTITKALRRYERLNGVRP